MEKHYDILICGAGIAGIATAYHLAVCQGVKNILLVDERPPLSLTSDKSTEAYRNWWPGPDAAMVQMMNHSIDWLEKIALESQNVIRLNRRGYLFATASTDKIHSWIEAARVASSYGAGPLRIHDGNHNKPYQETVDPFVNRALTGADLIVDPILISRYFPYLSRETKAILHVRRAGWLSAQQLGKYLLEQALTAGVEFIQDRVDAIDIAENKIIGVNLQTNRYLRTEKFINAAGPFLKRVGELMGVKIPVFTERHQKASFVDHEVCLPREAPLVIWSDPQCLIWSPDERDSLRDDPDFKWMTEEFPGGVHARPDGEGGSQIVLMLWEYHTPILEPQIPVPLDDEFPELTLRGLTTMLPNMEVYLNKLPKPYLDGGYYTKTKENRPIACPLDVNGGYIIGALSGFGIMSAMAMGELLANYIVGKDLPDYAPAFSLTRYEDEKYIKMLESWGDSWQL